MKTLSLKVLGCAAVCGLLTITRAQTADDAPPGPPDNMMPPADAAMMVSPDGGPGVIVVPMQADMTDAGGPAMEAPIAQPAPYQPSRNQFTNPNQGRGRTRGSFAQQGRAGNGGGAGRSLSYVR